MIIDGKKIAQGIIEELKKKPKPEKFLGAFFVGDDITSISFLKQKEKTAKELGVDFRIYKFPVNIKQDELRKEVLKIAQHKTCGGAIVQLPLPEHINKHYVCNVISREKDVDVLGERALGAFYTGRNLILPPVVGVIKEIIENLKLEIKNCRVAVVGLGFLVGKPITTWLMSKTPEIYLLDESSDFSILKQADFVISGVGKPGLMKSAMLKEKAVIIDFGCSIVDGKVLGDFDISSLTSLSSLLWYTPTPGGTGPILVAKLFENFYKLNNFTSR